MESVAVIVSRKCRTASSAPGAAFKARKMGGVRWVRYSPEAGRQVLLLVLVLLLLLLVLFLLLPGLTLFGLVIPYLDPDVLRALSGRIARPGSMTVC